MRKSDRLVVAAALAAAALVSTRGFGPAAAASGAAALSTCIGNYSRCWSACIGTVINHPLPPNRYAEWRNCRNQCDANHSACVDRAFSPAAAKDGGSSKQPPKAGAVPR